MVVNLHCRLQNPAYWGRGKLLFMKSNHFRTWWHTIWQQEQTWYYLGIVLLVIFAFLRAWRLGLPHEVVFDEVYFPLDAQKYLSGQPFFDIHPPLGKWLISIPMAILGYFRESQYLVVGQTAQQLLCPDPTYCTYAFNWRLMPYFASMGTLTLVWLLFKKMTQSWRGALLGLFVVGLEGVMFVYSRLGLMDGILYFFIVAAFYTFVIALEKRSWTQVAWLLLAGVLAGAAVAVKWLGLAAIILCGVWFLLQCQAQFRQSTKKSTITSLTWLTLIVSLLLMAGVYVLSFIGEGVNWAKLSTDILVPFQDFWHGLREWHGQSFGFNKNLKDTHPYQSSWWSWPLLLRPVWYYYKQNAAGMIEGIISIGTPLLWWSAFASALVTLLFVWPKDIWQRCLLWSSLLMYVPWVLISRVSLLYYFMGVALVWHMLLAYNLWLVLVNSPRYKIYIYALLVLFLINFLALYPLFTAMPISRDYLNAVLWFVKWRS
jgi:dolichyl-phosphate-mannose-protein mannosyltransferase